MLIALILFLTGMGRAKGQRFSVASFKVLPNDVSAFISPVRDLNDEDCGLVKVIGSEEFVFSAPLGIVKRVDKVGEIWLYLPRGSKKITIKHADWGVLRDYTFPERIDSHMTYELRLNEPVKTVEAVPPRTVITTVRDTLVLTRVDTLVVRPVKMPVPLRLDVLATVGYGGRNRTVSGGVLLTAMKRHGGFLHVQSDFGRTGATIGECGKNGERDGRIPFYSGRTRHSAFMVNVGAAHRISGRVAIFEGVGYGSNTLAWELASSEGGGYVRNTRYCVRGIAAEAGVLMSFSRITVSASVATIRGTDWMGSIGVGIRLGNNGK